MLHDLQSLLGDLLTWRRTLTTNFVHFVVCLLIHAYSLNSIKVVVEATHKVAPISSFADAGLHPIMLENIRLCGYKVPTPIQAYGIPAILAGRDLMAVAQTGKSHPGSCQIVTKHNI